MNKDKIFHLYAMITIICWAASFPWTRLAIPYFANYSLGCLRYLSASIALVIFCLIFRIKPPAIKDWGWFFLAGGLGIFGYMLLFNQGMQTVSSSTSSVIMATAPVMTSLLAWLLYREKLRTYQWVAIAVEFSGIVLLAWLSGAFTMNVGVLWLLGCPMFMSVYNLVQRKLAKTYTGMQTGIYCIIAGSLCLMIFLPQSLPQLSAAPPSAVMYIVLLGVVSGAIGYGCWTMALSKAPKVSSATNYMFLTPFLATLMGILMTHEIPDSSTLIAGGVILSGVFLFNFGDRLFSLRAQR